MGTEIVKCLIADRAGFSKLYRIIDEDVHDKEIVIDLDLRFLEPMDVLILTKFTIFQAHRGCTISIHAFEGIESYLKAIGLIAFIEKNVERSTTIEGIPSLTAMPICRVERETMVNYIDATQRFMHRICADKDLDMLDLCLAELINNVYDHSQSPIDAYVFCQYYEDRNLIRLAVSDLGIGIPAAVNTFMQREARDELSNIESVRWAIRENMTTRSIPQNRGKGLDVVNSFAKANSSSWAIYSNDVWMQGYPSGNRYHPNPIGHFKGTIVCLDIKVDNLQNAEAVSDEPWSWT